MKPLNLDHKKKYLLACSYGPDSMALFYLLNQEGCGFDVAIVNYHLRAESNIEVEGLKGYCKLYNKKLHILDVKRSIARNIEDECRKIRYSYFRELVKTHGYDAVLVAHHQDDFIETYLLQKHRQNLPEFYGIRENTVIFDIEVIRPLLSYKKKELQQICDENNVPYMIDSSNKEITFLRNKIRHEIIDELDDKTRAKILEEIELKNKELESIFDVIKASDINDIKTLINFDEITYLYAINSMAKSVNPRASISKKIALELLKILRSSKPNISVRVPHNLYFVKEYDRAYFVNIKRECSYSYNLNSPMVLDTPYFYLDFTGDTKNRNVNEEDYPLIIRPAKKGDITKIKNYQVNVSRLYIDWKMPMSLRKKWPLIVNRNGVVIYVPRYRKDFVVDEQTNFFVKI